MEKEFNLLEKTQRLRYEAFSNFAAQVNKANDVATIGAHLNAQIKFILDAFILQIIHQYQHQKLSIEVYRGTCTVREYTDEATNDFAEELLGKDIPVYLSKEGLLKDARLAKSIFNHDKTLSFYALPIRIHDTHHIVIALANKETSLYTEVDFRFIRLICDLLSSKLSQLFLLNNVEKKNQQLEQANDKLANANEELVTLNEKIGCLNLTLEKKVEERTYELKKANEELQTIFYRASHDLRRPLTTILGLVQLAELNTEDAGTLQLFGHCKQVIAQMEAMFSKLSLLSSLEMEEWRKESVDLKGLAESIQAKFQARFITNNIGFTTKLSVQNPFFGYGEMLKSMVENLVENAIIFRSHAPVIALEISEKEEHTAEEKKLIIQVTDNGQGIEEKEMDKIFDIYYRANINSKGNGLGLYVVKKLAGLLSGEVHVESKPKQGSVFTLILPFNKLSTLR
jgi:signal transduction histidine kinase